MHWRRHPADAQAKRFPFTAARTTEPL
jgi:hypothetical protein